MATPAYDEHYYEVGHIDEDRPALWYYARVLRRLRPEGGRLLDFGCGTGHLLRRLSGTFEAMGFDASPYARHRARMNAPEATILEDVDTIEPDSLDAIVSLHTLEHLRRPQVVLPGLARLLAPGGVILFVVPNTSSMGRRLKREQWFGYRDPTHISMLSRGEWMSAVRQAKLEPLWVRGDGWWDAPYIRLLPTVVQRALFGAPAALQFGWPIARPFLPPQLGECLIFAARRP